MKVNLNKQFKNLKGEEFKGDGSNMGMVLAEVLSASNKGNGVKLYDWSIKLYNKKDLEMDENDFKMLKALLEDGLSNKEQSGEKVFMLNNLCRAQILNELEAAETKAKK